MLPKSVREPYLAIPKAGWFSNPLKDLRRLEVLDHGLIETWVGERTDGSQALIRTANSQSGLRLLLNEWEVGRAASHENLGSPAWAVRSRQQQLDLGTPWGPRLTLTYPLDLRWLLRSLIHLSRAVSAMHHAGYIHADIKPESVRWTDDPQHLILFDLRLAQPPGPRRFEAYSARYASPEQIAGGELTWASDVYALGGCLYSLFIKQRFPQILVPDAAPEAPVPERLSAITAFAGPSPTFSSSFEAAELDTQGILGAKVLFSMELERVKQRTEDIGIADKLLAVISKATAPKPEERYPDAEALAAALAELLARAEELNEARARRDD